MCGLYGRLMSLPENHHFSNLTYQICFICLTKGMKPMNARFTILNGENTLQSCRNAFSRQYTCALWICPHLKKQCIFSWWFMVSPQCGPSKANHANCRLVELKGVMGSATASYQMDFALLRQQKC